MLTVEKEADAGDFLRYRMCEFQANIPAPEHVNFSRPSPPQSTRLSNGLLRLRACGSQARIPKGVQPFLSGRSSVLVKENGRPSFSHVSAKWHSAIPISRSESL